MTVLPSASTDHSHNHAPQKSVIIIGGGFSGATLAYHLATTTDPAKLKITIIEPRQHLGAGLAYSTEEEAFRLNVLSDRMSIFYDDKPHFARWIEETHSLNSDPEATTENGQTYARRSLFGSYMADQLAPLLASGQVQHLIASATGANRNSDGTYTVSMNNGTTLEADFLVIAASHPLPALPAPLRALVPSGQSHIAGLTANPYQGDALKQLIEETGTDSSVLIIGAGLTSADMVAGLSQHGHSGKITVLSRHGLRSRPNLRLKTGELKPPRLFGDFLNPPETSATQLLRKIRKTIRDAALQSIPWQSVIDALRDQGDAIWHVLPLSERQRIVRHLRTYWDAHRFRLATQTDDVLEQRSRANTLDFLSAHVTGASYADNGKGFMITYRRRGESMTIEQHFDAIIITTGPAHGDIIGQCAPLAMLHQDGLIEMDPTGLGLHTSRNEQVLETMRAISKDGSITDNLFIAGPLARGTFGELMGAPEVARYTQRLAEVIRQAVQQPLV
ncbi:FAD/NAD(P)-binding protein [Pseudochrobactrum kiredjianiae]|uniref:FAD/NAD(P)-binding protein n=1 Tax=Pseudochrobactrum kiredjianiae TaxID=386305 RepID=A0ABW3V890_9HYPH|nr:FAD/NAD(P)-binding protein [Pseudochrobactrum kiredjianiae]MDM7850240.1 FAD/NAD(P)-binding protein [Pseudochrobactrum kiredjianiae]